MAIGTKIAIAKQCNKKAHYVTASLNDGYPGCCHNPKTCKSLSGKWWNATGGVGGLGEAWRLGAGCMKVGEGGCCSVA